ncbi:MAG: DUF3048 domain-containing protein [Firmicutes bacterium]|nr:DUF3048 domain-containing protein [Bacillota bacterium]
MKIKLNKNNKKLIVIGLIVLIIVLGIGLTIAFWPNENEEEKVVEKNDNNNEQVPEVEEEVKKLQIVDVLSTSRPFAVMVNNISTARPYQSGLQDAFIIYELIAEGGITRYMALFMDQKTERIGSVRSARHYYLDYALENDAIYVHHGQSPQAQADFRSLGVDRVEVNDNKTGWRDKSLPVSSEHTLFTSIEKLNNGMSDKRSKRKQELLLNYSVDEVNLSDMPNVKTADKVSIQYSNNTTSSYEYDSENKVYKRFVNKKEHKDYVTKEQYTFKNIITYQVDNYTLNDGENKGRQGLNNIGSGTGYYITNGYAVPIKWSKKSRSAQTIYTYENGEKIDVNDGNTFIQIQPKGQNLSIS